MKLLNVACGSRYHTDWINIDFYADSKDVRKVNILQGLPFENESIDIIYCSHFFEHLNKKQVIFLSRECKRVLKTNGILRIVVPDLENICREYLRILENTSDFIEQKKYNWITIELLDQLVRINGGGEMLKIFTDVSEEKDIEMMDYIKQRVGVDLSSNQKINKKRKITFDKIKNKFLSIYLKLVRKLVPGSIRDMVISDTPIGEKHQWMYDKFSISKILEDSGFKKIFVENYNTSKIPLFNDYLLDINFDGTPYKGSSSIYIEVIK